MLESLAVIGDDAKSVCEFGGGSERAPVPAPPVEQALPSEVWAGLVRSVQALSATVADLPLTLRRPTVDAAVAIAEEVGLATGWLVRHALASSHPERGGDAPVRGSPAVGAPPLAGTGGGPGGVQGGSAGGVRVVRVPGERSSGRDRPGPEHSPAPPAVPGSGPPPGSPQERVSARAGAGPDPSGEVWHAAGPGPERITELAALATRLVEDARRRRGLAGGQGDAGAGMDQGAQPGPAPGQLPGPGRESGAGPGWGTGRESGAGPACGAGPPPDVWRLSGVGREGGGEGVPGTGEHASASGASGALADALAAVAAAVGPPGAVPRRVVVGFADVVGEPDPGSATRILQSRVLGALRPGDAPFLLAPGEAVFLLRDADLVDADQRFRHLRVSRRAPSPVVRLGFAVPRPGDDARELVGRATRAATGRRSNPASVGS